MTVAEFKSQLETFLHDLRAHQAAWRHAQGWPLTGVKRRALEEQAHRLARHLGRLRPLIHRFMAPQEWVMHQPASGLRWDALDEAVGSRDVVKGSSMQMVVDKLTQLLGRLDGMNQTADLSKPASPGPSGTPPSPPRVTTPAPKEPVTLEKVPVHRLVSALGNLSVRDALYIVGLLATLVGITITVTRWVDQRAIDTARDSVRVQQRVIDAERHRGDSLAAVLNRRPGKTQ